MRKPLLGVWSARKAFYPIRFARFSTSPAPSQPLFHLAHQILQTPDPSSKTSLTQRVFGNINIKGSDVRYDYWGIPDGINISDRKAPSRPAGLKLVSPKEMPTAKQAGVSSSIYLTHSLAHIELNAVELAWDTLMMAAHEKLPEEFFKDFISIAADEARHFDLLCDHLKSQGSQYGAIPAHDNLWNIAIKTKDDILARVAMIQLVQEPRALDSHDRLRKKFIGAQDKKAVQLIDVICYEEIEHVRIGMKWYEYLCRRAHKEPIPTFHALATQLAVVIPPPFNVQSRQQAGMPPEWYLPIAKTHKAHPKSSH